MQHDLGEPPVEQSAAGELRAPSTCTPLPPRVLGNSFDLAPEPVGAGRQLGQQRSAPTGRGSGDTRPARRRRADPRRRARVTDERQRSRNRRDRRRLMLGTARGWPCKPTLTLIAGQNHVGGDVRRRRSLGGRPSPGPFPCGPSARVLRHDHRGRGCSRCSTLAPVTSRASGSASGQRPSFVRGRLVAAHQLARG